MDITALLIPTKPLHLKDKNEFVSFKKKFTFEQRLAEAEKIKTKNPDRIPIIVERSVTNTTIDMIDRNKFLVPLDTDFAKFSHVIRRRIKLKESDALFFFINNKLPIMNELIGKIYEENKDQDQFLYVTYTGLETFG